MSFKDVKVLITKCVAESPKPVALSSLASKALKEVEGLDAANWAGFGGFKRLVENIQLPKLTVDWNTGAVLDPVRHAASAQKAEVPVDEVALDTVLEKVALLVQNELDQAGRPVPCARLAN